jgi:comEA protein
MQWLMPLRTQLRKQSRTLPVVLTLAFGLFVAPSFAKKKPPASPVNLNTATSAQLQQVPGIGPSTADKILQMRKSYGAFKSVNDLLAVRGIGPKRLEKMRKYLVVSKTPPPNSASAKKPSGTPSAAKGLPPLSPAPVAKSVPKTEEPEEP